MRSISRSLVLKLGTLLGLVLACLLALHAYSLGRPKAAKTDSHRYQSLTALRARIAELKAKHGEEEDERAQPGVKEDESLDYLEALEAYLSVRAYPNDYVDWDVLRRGAKHRDEMASGTPMTPGNKWTFLGPTNCTSPYTWAFGPGKVSGRIASAAFDPTDSQTFYIASAGGGAWKTADSGATWTALGDGWANLPTSCIVVDPHDPKVLFVGTGDWDGWGGYGQGIERSTDGGATWTQIGSEFANYAVRRILIDPENSAIVTVVTGRGPGGNGKVWRSTDGGNTWTAVITVGSLWTDIVCGAADNSGNRDYYACSGGKTAQVWKSTDRGATWSKLTVPLRIGISDYDTSDLAASPTTYGTVYLLGTGNQKVWKSTNNGGTWTDVTDGTLAAADWGQAWYDFYISCSSNGSSDVLYVGLIDILQSANGGGSWHSLMNGYSGNDLAHVDEHDIVVNPANPNLLLACCDGGVYRVDVSGSTGAFTSLNQGLGITEFYWGDFHPSDATRMIGGAQDNGSPASRGNLANWGCISGGDGGAALINQSNANIQYSTYQYFGGSSSGGTIGFNRTSNNWSSSSWVSVNVNSDRVAWMGPLVMAASNSSTVYVPTNYLWKYSDQSGWTPRLGGQSLSTSSTVLSIGVTKADANFIYTGSGDGQLWLTRNGGTAWTQINTGAISLPNKAYTAIRVRDDNPNELLVGLSGSGVSHLWRCFDTSGTSRTWVDVSGTGPSGLPDVPINGIELDPADPANTWYVGTDIGVFRTQNAGSSWQNISQPLGLPNVQVSQLVIRNNVLFAVTYGRGMWKLNLAGTGGGGNVTVTGLGVDPGAVVGPASSTGTVTLSGPAPTGGVTVALSSNNAVATLPSTVTVPEGAVSASFTVSTVVVPSQTIATLTATLNTSTATADLTVNPNGLINITLNPVSVIGGNTSQASIVISTPAPAGGSVVQITSSNTAVAQVPSTVTIPAGSIGALFTVTTTPTANDATSTIKATLGTSSVQTQITVNSPTVQSFTLASSSIVGGNTVLGTIVMTGKAPAAGLQIPITSSDPTIASVPATVNIASGQTTGTFVVTSHVVPLDSGVTISETYHGILRTVDLSVLAQKVSSVTITPNPTVGGSTVVGRVVLAGPAITGVSVQLSSSNTALATVPATVTVPAGQGSATFNVITRQVTTSSPVIIYAVLGGSSQQTTLLINPLQLGSFTLSTNTTFERSTVTGTVALNGNALSGGAVVHIANGNSAAATMPASVTIPQGQNHASFTITAASVASVQTTTIVASLGSASLQQTLTVTPITIQSIQLSTSSVTGGTQVSGVVRIVAPAPSGGYVVKLASSYPTVATVPATVTIPANSASATFIIKTNPVAQTYFVSIAGTHNLSTATTQLQVIPPEVSTFKLSTSSIKGGKSLTGTVTLTGKAPTGGMIVHISANPAQAWPDAGTVKVPAGATSVSFKIDTSVVSSTSHITMSAVTLSIVRTAALTLTP